MQALTSSQRTVVEQTASERDTAIKAIRKALRIRSGKPWSVTGGRGTAWGWILITSAPARRPDGSSTMNEQDRAELAKLLGLERVHHQGEHIPGQLDFRRVFVCRALHGHADTYTAEANWD